MFYTYVLKSEKKIINSRLKRFLIYKIKQYDKNN